MNDKVDKDVSVSKYNHTKKPIITKKKFRNLTKEDWIETNTASKENRDSDIFNLIIRNC